MSTEEPEVAPGAVLAGKYRVERVLGRGGMGFVLAATHLELHQPVAVKFLHEGAFARGEAVARFMREARAAARIRSEHVVRVLDVGRLDDGSPYDGSTYMVMEFLEGEDLGAVVARGPLPIDDALDLMLQACHAIAEAHQAGIVHRDLKPSNLFLARRPDGSRVLKVLDFGISKMTEQGPAAQLTQDAASMGTPLYMSPEQLKSTREVDARGDIWAIGVILYELLAGKPPFDAQSYSELVLAIVTGEPPSLRLARAGVPSGLEQSILRCMAKQRELRFSSVGELARALAPFAPRHAQHLVERIAHLSKTDPPPFSATERLPPQPEKPHHVTEPMPPGALPVQGAATGPTWAQTQPAQAPSRLKLAAAGAAIAVVALGAGLTWSRIGTTPAPAASVPLPMTTSDALAGVENTKARLAETPAAPSAATALALASVAPAIASVAAAQPASAAARPLARTRGPSSTPPSTPAVAAAPAPPVAPTVATPTRAAPPAAVPPAADKSIDMGLK